MSGGEWKALDVIYFEQQIYSGVFLQLYICKEHLLGSYCSSCCLLFEFIYFVFFYHFSSKGFRISFWDNSFNDLSPYLTKLLHREKRMWVINLGFCGPS